jgi:hypothetical protein
MPEEHDRNYTEEDHGLLVRIDERVKNLTATVKTLQDKIDTLMNDRAKLIGICVGVSGGVAIVVKIFWPNGHP